MACTGASISVWRWMQGNDGLSALRRRRARAARARGRRVRARRDRGRGRALPPAIDALLEADLDGVEPEPDASTSRSRPPHEPCWTAPCASRRRRSSAGDADAGELLDATLARIEERNPELNAIVETFPEQSREMLADAPARPAARRAGGDQGRVAAAVAGGAPRRGAAARRRAAARGVGPVPRAARRRGGDRRRREHARVRGRQHRPHLRLRAGPQPVGHRSLPGRLLERPGRRRRRAARRGSGRAPTGSARSATRPPTAGSPA